LLALLSAGTALVFAEAAARFLDLGESPVYREHEGDRMFTPDETLGWRSVPHSRYRLWSPEYEIEVENNALGFRGPEPSELDNLGDCRILVIGDSFVQGLTVSYENSFGHVAEAEIERTTGRACSVISAGVEGFNTAQEHLFLERELAAYRPSLVVLFFFYNDIWCNVALRGCDNLGADSLVALKAESTEYAIEVLLPAALQPGRPLGWAAWLAERSRLVHLLTGLLAGVPEARETPGDVPLRSDLFMRPLADRFRVFKRELDRDVEIAWSVTESYLVQMASLVVEGLGARFAVFHVPLRESIQLEEWEFAARIHDLEAEEWSFTGVEERLREVCTRNGLDCLFAADRFRAASGQRRSLYFRNDPHWNASGHHLVGRMLAEHWLEPGPVIR
jgi:hypothetical protein